MRLSHTGMVKENIQLLATASAVQVGRIFERARGPSFPKILINFGVNWQCVYHRRGSVIPEQILAFFSKNYAFW